MAKYISDFRQGDTKRLKISYGINVTGYQFRISFFTDFTKPAILEVTTTAGDDNADVPLEGLVYLEITSTESATIPLGKYFYQVQRIITGTPDDIYTIIPEIKDYKDKVSVV